MLPSSPYRSNPNLEDIINYRNYCLDLYNKYKIKHHEFLKYYLVIKSLFKIFQTFEYNNPIEYNDLLSNWKLDIDNELQQQKYLSSKIDVLKGKFDQIKLDEEDSSVGRHVRDEMMGRLLQVLHRWTSNELFETIVSWKSNMRKN